MASPNAKIPRESYENFGGINQKASLYLTDNSDVLSLKNLDFNRPGSLSSTPGSAFYLSATFTGKVTGLYEYTKLSGTSFVIFSANNTLYQTDGVLTSPIRIGVTPGAQFDFVTFVDTLFAANGAEFLKYDGTTVTKFSTPAGNTITLGMGVAAVGMSGTFNYAFGYLNTSGYFSAVSQFASIAVSGTQVIASGFTYPSDYGITAGVLYRSNPGSLDLFFYSYIPLGGQTFVDSGTLTLGNMPVPDSVFFTLAPRYLEIFQNSLFMIGSSQFPSTAFFSELGEPENVLPESNFEVRTNDGDILTGGKFYGNALFLFKKNSFSKVIGNDTTNFSLLDVSDQYGCLSNRSVVVYNDIMLWLDRKGICRYNGATPEIISTKIEQTFLNMNIDAAINNACGVHDKYRNQVTWGIPVNGATFNNLTIVYDYLADAWTTKDGYNPAITSYVQSSFPRQRVFYGSYSGSIHYISSDLYNNNGQGITFSMQSKFHNIFGNSRTGQYRRLFVDTDPIPGATIPLTINFRVDEQPDIVLTRTIYFNQYQTRIDFGIPAKSLSIEFVASSASFPIRINGYTLEARLQRNV